ncbi:hypothetical protein BJY01DRAFT_242688 [Aspergillus pseudoustus]|uniref:AAA+ ATPase domain-containing protein n=1 Tax=Aspergillus pseudoustus TaxID=1810923 RepID=A0ABR4KWL1_9EURO
MATTNQEQENSDNDKDQKKKGINVFLNQFETDDCLGAALPLPSSQFPVNIHRPPGEAPNASNPPENTALRGHMMRLMQAERKDKIKLLAARREWESRNVDARSTSSVVEDSDPQGEAGWDYGSFYRVLHRFTGSHEIFFEPPVWEPEEDAFGERRYTVQFEFEGVKVDDFLDSNENIAFVIIKTYEPVSPDGFSTTHVRTADRRLLPSPESESLLFVSKDMIEAVEAFRMGQPNFHTIFPDFDARKEHPAPYLFWFTFRYAYPSAVKHLSFQHRSLLKSLAEWISENYQEEYERVDNELLRGVVCSETMKYLVRPGDVLVSREGGRDQAYLATSWAKERWKVFAWSYEVDGAFFYKNTTLEITFDIRDSNNKVDLRTLSVVPLQYTSLETAVSLQERGKNYWPYREKRLVSYYGSAGADYVGSGERFMIDLETYRLLHPPLQDLTESNPKREEVPPLCMLFDEPPSAPFIYLFPPTIIGYSLSSKKWLNLDVEMIQGINWNTRAFESLVIEEDSKEILQAIISCRSNPRIGVDIIEGKEASLVILLHGPSGTGKTYTAESLAELAKRPLYRLTCAEIGTEPQQAEERLKSALYLSKIWDCIILLDDIDVFWEEHTSIDFKRNALLTVLLNALESYSGLIILTARYISKPNDAFKSRVQYAVRYRHPTCSQRRKIWQNFIDDIKEANENGIDYEDVKSHLNGLAEVSMTGRQIRNTITTGRQLAEFRGRKMAHTELKHVISLQNQGGLIAYSSEKKEEESLDGVVAS